MRPPGGRSCTAPWADGFGIALDDIGAHPDSLALLDVVCPDVVKLDLRLIQFQPDDEQARSLAAVLAHQERTGSVLLAEGIDTDAHLERALAMGATLGQGYKFGRPEPLDDQISVGWSPPPMKHPVHSAAATPFGAITDEATVRTARKETLLAFCRHIEIQATSAIDPPMVLTTLQRAENFTGSTRDRYREAAKSSPLVAVFGQDLPEDLGLGIRGVRLSADDPLCKEWAVLILGPHQAAALIAHERDDDGAVADEDRRFDFTITYDRLLVTVAARNLIDRIP